MKNAFLFISFVLFTFFVSCKDPNPNIDPKGEDELKSLEVLHELNSASVRYQETFYVPIYSDIYIDDEMPNGLLSATLSIRNTSYNDSLFIAKINYYDTDGKLVRSYLDKDISLPPMASINYVIEKEDEAGGSGANFMVDMQGRNQNLQPIVQAVMIGQTGNKAFAFTTEGRSIK